MKQPTGRSRRDVGMGTAGTAGTVDTAPARSFARSWAAAVAGTSYVTLTDDELLDYLTDLAGRLAAALLGDEPVAVAREVGTALVREHFTEVGTLSASLQVITKELADHLGVARDPESDARVAQLCGELAAGYSVELRNRTLAEQEAISNASLRARDRAEAALRVSEARFRAIFAEAGVGMAIADLGGDLIDVNGALCDISGYSAGELRGHSAFEFLLGGSGGSEGSGSGATGDAVASRATSSALLPDESKVHYGRDVYRRYRRLRRADGELRWVHITVTLIRDEQGEPAYQLAVVEDVTQRLRLQERIRRQAMHDALTGLSNRSAMMEWLAGVFGTATDRASRGAAGTVGACLLNIDGFKMINDSLGAEVGDQVLVEVAARLRAAVVGEGRIVARMGGDEFAVLATDCTDTEEVATLARRALHSLDPPLRIAGQELSISARAGVVVWPLGYGDAAELIRDADITLGWAKSDGVRLARYDRERNAGQLARYGLAAAMPSALEAGEFYVDYQPLVRMSEVGGDGAPVGVEALVRWQHPELGRLGPDRFIGLAEETGLIVALGQWVLEQACAQAGAWYREYGERAPFVSVNLAVRQVQQPRLLDTVSKVLADTGLPAQRLQLELTESAIMESAGGPLATLHALAERGMNIAIDDFGTGYSNFAYLRHLPIHSLKLASSFVEGLDGGEEGALRPVDDAIVSTLVSLAHALGMSVTAEGVETPEQAQRLRVIGCECGQGWLYGKPGPPETIEAMLSRGCPPPGGQG